MPMFPIHFPDKKNYDLFKQILQEVKQHTRTPYWRYLLTTTAEDLNKLNNIQLEAERKKSNARK